MTDILLFLTGIVVGGMNAVAGGGMLIGFPVAVALGLPPLVVGATSSVITTPGQIASAWGYRAYIRRVPRRFLLLIIPLVLGSIGGALTLRNTSADHFADIIPFLVFLGVGLFAFQPLLHFHVSQHIRGKHRTIKPLYLIALAMLPLAFYGGYFGAGFGFIMLAFLSFAKLADAHMMNGIKNLGATCVSLTALACLYSSGLIDWRLGLIMGTGSLLGGYAGSRLSQRLSTHVLRVIVIVIGLSAVVYLALQNY
jgi:uncharacterized protein